MPNHRGLVSERSTIQVLTLSDRDCVLTLGSMSKPTNVHNIAPLNPSLMTGLQSNAFRGSCSFGRQLWVVSLRAQPGGGLFELLAVTMVFASVTIATGLVHSPPPLSPMRNKPTHANSFRFIPRRRVGATTPHREFAIVANE
mmetsp:Transcript_87220/g.244760  ORF Transcript_87220/g.244760 Transcript_87220/m.244760 type:complete len:142 (+) Transcript_87220:210-635(+)